MAELAQVATRRCTVCDGHKPVSGVWYLLAPARAARLAPFVCESCFRVELGEPHP